jgi:hypothetical protein
LKEFANNIPQKLADYGNNYEDPVQSGIKYKHSSTYSFTLSDKECIKNDEVTPDEKAFHSITFY